MKSFFFMSTKITADISDDRNPKTLEVGLFTSSNFAELGMFPSINFNVIAKEMKQSRFVTPLVPGVIDWVIIKGSKILLTTKQMYSICNLQFRVISWPFNGCLPCLPAGRHRQGVRGEDLKMNALN